MGRKLKKTWSSANDNFVADGNSLVFGYHSSSTANSILGQLRTMSAINNGLTFNNKAVSGQSITDMINTASDIDGAWVAGKNNYLFIWEFTNSIFNATAQNGGKTGQQTFDLLAQYVAARRAANQWKGIACLTGLPRVQVTMPRAGDTNDSLNAQMDIANALLKANYRSIGIDAVGDVRAPGGPFDTTGIPSLTFASVDGFTYNGLPVWSTQDTANVHIHLQDNGFTYVARVANEALKRLPA